MGAAVFDCPCLGEDIAKILDIYWEMGAPNVHVPSTWPDTVATNFNSDIPISARLNNENDVVYFSVGWFLFDVFEFRLHRQRFEPENVKMISTRF